MLSHAFLPNLSTLSIARPRQTKAHRLCLKGVAVTRCPVLKAPLAALVVGVLSGLGWSPIADAGTVTDWNTIATDLVAANQDPPTQTHTLAIVHTAIHDALNAIAPQYEPYTYAGSAPGASAAAAVAAATRDTLIPLLPSAAAAIDAEYTAALAVIPNGPAKDAGVLTGQRAAAAFLDTKFNDNFWRPITAIRAGNNDGNSSTKGDPTWEPFCVTPPFPEHNSTHAVTAPRQRRRWPGNSAIAIRSPSTARSA